MYYNKKRGRNKLDFLTLFNELTWEERGKVEIMAIITKIIKFIFIMNYQIKQKKLK